MKVYFAIFCIILLQGVAVNSQSSTLDSIMNTLNSAYRSYKSGEMISTARGYVRSAMNGLNQLQSAINSMSAPSLGSGRSSLPSLPSPPQLPQIPPQWPWVLPGGR